MERGSSSSASSTLGASVVQGLLLSPNAYSVDHFAASVGSARVQLQSWVAELDPRTDSTGTLQYRYMMQNRPVDHPSGRWTAALGAASVTSGPGDELDFWDLNPATVSYFRAGNGLDDVNSFVDVDFERRAKVTVYGQFMLDDIQVSRKVLTDDKPASFGLTLGAKGGSQSGGVSWVIFYTQVAALTYRNEDNEQVPEYFGGQGIGRQFNDYDQVTAQLNLLRGPTFLLQPEVDIVQ